MAEINTWGQFEHVVLDIVHSALLELGEMVENKIKYYIDQDVYVGQNKVYEPTYEFRESFTSVDVGSKSNPEVLIHSDKNKMTSKPEIFQHGSYYSRKGSDIREWLPEILAFNLSGDITPDWFGDGFWKHRDNYFYDTLESLRANGWLSKTFKQLLRKRGLTVK